MRPSESIILQICKNGFLLRCDFRHSRDRSNVGENIWAHSLSDYTNAARLWYDEVYDPACHCGRTFKVRHETIAWNF